MNIKVGAGTNWWASAGSLVDFQLQFLGDLVSTLPPVIAAPDRQSLAVSADAVHTVSDLTDGVIDRLAQLTPNVPLAQTHSRQTSRTATSLQPNVGSLRRDDPKPIVVARDPTNAATAPSGDTGRGVSDTFRDAVRHSLSGIGDHQQQHRRDRHQDKSAEDKRPSTPNRTTKRGDPVR